MSVLVQLYTSPYSFETCVAQSRPLMQSFFLYESVCCLDADILAHPMPRFHSTVSSQMCVFSHPPLLLDKKFSVSMEEGAAERYGMEHTGSFYISDDASCLVVHEFDADLGDAAAGA